MSRRFLAFPSGKMNLICWAVMNTTEQLRGNIVSAFSALSQTSSDLILKKCPPNLCLQSKVFDSSSSKSTVEKKEKEEEHRPISYVTRCALLYEGGKTNKKRNVDPLCTSFVVHLASSLHQSPMTLVLFCPTFLLVRTSCVFVLYNLLRAD